MNYVNPPQESPPNISHKTFFSHTMNHEIGYNIYLPPDYEESGLKYPVEFYIHGWKGNESSDIWTLAEVCRNRQAITVFINASVSVKDDYFDAVWELESIFIKELIPYIDVNYKTSIIREDKMISGMSMGGMLAFYFAVKYPDLFSSVTPYAGTYHHQYHKDYNGVGESPEKAVELYEEMMKEERYFEENNILSLVRQNADKIRGNLHIDIRIGTDDILFCDNEIMHLYLNSLNIPHEYRKYIGAGHELEKIL